MPRLFESRFYETMWRSHARNQGKPFPWYPVPWWVQQYLFCWPNDYDDDHYDRGLFESKEAAFTSNACFRYWSMVGVKDAPQEVLIGQAGEIEPVYDVYALSLFLFDPAVPRLAFPQMWHQDGGRLEQRLDPGGVPVITTRYESAALGVAVTSRALATTFGKDQKSIVLSRYSMELTAGPDREVWLGLLVSPCGPSGFQRHDRAGRYRSDRRVSFMRYDAATRLVVVNAIWGPIFLGDGPSFHGLYGNESASQDDDHYVTNSPFVSLMQSQTLNNESVARDFLAGMCQGAFVWRASLRTGQAYSLDVLCPVDDYRGLDIDDLRRAIPAELDSANTVFWNLKLATGAQLALPPSQRQLGELYQSCRANVLILADDGVIHPGPTIYDEFWIRDSSIEGVACALAGDSELARQQFANHYPDAFSLDDDNQGTPVALQGFFGGPHEIRDREWDSNGEALWAFGKVDRILGAGAGFGASMYLPYVIEAARWLGRSRPSYGLLPQGWSAEHLGGANETHVWDHLWALTGLWEAAQLARRIGAPETGEIWSIYDDVKRATCEAIRVAMAKQREAGAPRTFIPRSTEAWGELDSRIIGAVAYFHPCRLYMGQKLGADMDAAARATLDLIYEKVDGGFRHDEAWHCYGPYLTLQLAHAFLLLGQIDRMQRCLSWCESASSPAATKSSSGMPWPAALRAWNEQHCYPIATDYDGQSENRPPSWYMGDIPHGWACAEYMLLVRDLLFFEADEDGSPHVYVAPGLAPEWLGDGESIGISNAPTLFGSRFGYRLTHDGANKELALQVVQGQPLPAKVQMVVPCRFGKGVRSVTANGAPVTISGADVWLPPGTTSATIQYL